MTSPFATRISTNAPLHLAAAAWMARKTGRPESARLGPESALNRGAPFVRDHPPQRSESSRHDREVGDTGSVSVSVSRLANPREKRIPYAEVRKRAGL
jgi:hypothetical protein